MESDHRPYQQPVEDTTFSDFQWYTSTAAAEAEGRQMGVVVEERHLEEAAAGRSQAEAGEAGFQRYHRNSGKEVQVQGAVQPEHQERHSRTSSCQEEQHREQRAGRIHSFRSHRKHWHQRPKEQHLHRFHSLLDRTSPGHH